MHCGWHAELCAESIAIQDRFLPSSQVDALVDCAALRCGRGEFVAARIGGSRTPRRRADIRGDSICWLTEPLFTPERELCALLEQLRLQLNRDALLGLFELELHYAHYPPGAGYARHVDRPRGSELRRVSLALYLNRHWTPADGGHLRIFAGDGSFRDIEPVAGRLVLFLTERREHAVMPTRRGRLSLTGWLRGRE